MKRRIPFVEQHQSTECGLCCVAMISSYFGHEVTLQELRKQKETGRDGTSFGQLIDLLGTMGFKIKSFKYPKSEKILPNIQLPAIALWEQKHFVVIEKIRHNSVFIIDPELGRIKYSYEEFLSGFSQYLISVKKTSQVKKRKSSESYQKIYKLVLQSWLYFIPLFILTLISYALTFFIPLFIQQVLNSYQQHLNYLQLLFALAIFSILYFLIGWTQKNASIALTSKIDKTLNNSVLSKLFKLPYKFFATRSRGDLVYSINGLSRIRELFSSQFLLGLLDLGLGIAILIYLLMLRPLLFYISLSLLILNLSLLLISNSTIEHKNKSLVRAQNEVQNKQIEIIYSILGIKMEGFEAQVKEQWDEKFKKYIYRFKDSGFFSNTVSSIFDTLSFISPFILLIITMEYEGNTSGSLGNLFSVDFCQYPRHILGEKFEG